MLIKPKACPDDEKVKPQGLKLPYVIPTEVDAYPPEVPTVTESESSIDSVTDDSILVTMWLPATQLSRKRRPTQSLRLFLTVLESLETKTC
jgi:hypothetical protein